jgi:hypothetical protein
MNPILRYAVYFDSWPESKRKLLQFSKKYKISTIKRQQFYTHHRKSLRSVYSYYRTNWEPIYAWAKSSKYF